MTTSENTKHLNERERKQLIADLRELIAALDRRVPHIERAGEQRIARDSAELRKTASERLAELEADPP